MKGGKRNQINARIYSPENSKNIHMLNICLEVRDGNGRGGLSNPRIPGEKPLQSLQVRFSINMNNPEPGGDVHELF